MSITTVALSTVFTPPASCSTSWTYEGQLYNGITGGILLQNALPNYMDSECFPPGFAQAGRVFAGQVFSPGACPLGYTTHSPIQIANSITTVTCCSSDYSYTSSTYQGCLSIWSGGTSLIARAGGFTAANTITNTSLLGTFTIWALPVTVELQASDVSLYTTMNLASTTSTLISSIPTSVSTTNVGTPSSTAISETQPSGLSTGTKAGIGIGAAAGALILVGVSLLLVRRYRRSRKEGLAEASSVYCQTDLVPSSQYYTLEELENNEAKKPTAKLRANNPELPELQ